jgi:hypothetical protein
LVASGCWLATAGRTPRTSSKSFSSFLLCCSCRFTSSMLLRDAATSDSAPRTLTFLPCNAGGLLDGCGSILPLPTAMTDDLFMRGDAASAHAS